MRNKRSAPTPTTKPSIQQYELPQSLTSKRGQYECRLVDLLAVVFAQLLLLFLRPCSKRFLHVSVGILAADHKADLARGISWDSGISILDNREDLLAGLLKVGDQTHVEPLILSFICGMRKLACAGSVTYMVLGGS